MSEYTIKVSVKGDSDDNNLRTFEAGLQRVEQQAERTASATKSLTSAIKDELMGAIGNIVALGTFIKFLKDGTEAVLDEERALRQLSGMARQFGQDGAAAATAAKALGDSLQKVGYDDDQVLKDVRELLPLTRDYAQAISAVSLAYDVNARTGMPVAQALGLIQQLIAGNERDLKTAMRDLGIEAETTAEALAKMETDFRGAAAEVDDGRSKISGAKAELDDLGKMIGGPVSEAIIFAIKWLKGLGQAWAGIGLAAVTAGQFVAFAGRSIVNAAKRDFDTISADFTSTMAGIKGQWTEWRAQFGDIFGGDGPKAASQPKLEPRKSSGDKSTKDDPWLKQILERIKAIQSEQDARERADDAARKSGQAALDARARQLEQERQKQATVDAARAASGQRALDARARQYEAEQKLAQYTAEQQVALARDAAAGAAGAMAAAFPEIKAFAIAEAIINTYLGVTQALKAYPPPWSFIAAAAQLAYGMAQVQKIQSTEPGSGGGASSGASSRAGGGVQVYGTGSAGTGMAGDGGKTVVTNTTNQNAPAQQVTINALTGNQAAQAHREFERTKGAGVRQANRAVVNRSRTTITQAGR